jgi:hypothetical protein
MILVAHKLRRQELAGFGSISEDFSHGLGACRIECRSVGRRRVGVEVPVKPISGQSEFGKGSLVEPDHHLIVSAHDEQRRGLHTRERDAGEIGPSAV